MRIRGPEVDVAKHFLEQINTETALMLSLMADGADDGLELTRLHDDWDKMDAASLSKDVRCFLLKIIERYSEGHVLAKVNQAWISNGRCFGSVAHMPL